MAFYSFQNLHEAYNSMRNFAAQAPHWHCLNSWFPTGPELISQQTQKMFNYIESCFRRNIFLFRISMGRTEEFISSI